MFSNKTINYLNLHIALWIVGNRIVIFFGPVYLVKIGISLPLVMFAWGMSNLIRFLLRPLSLWWTHKIGLKKALIIGTFVSAGIFPIFMLTHGVDFWLWILVFYLGISDIAYWLPYHAFYASAGNPERRGKQTAAREALILMFSAITPIVGGFLASIFGFWSLYVAGILATLISAWPLFHTSDLNENQPLRLRQALRTIDQRGFWLAVGDGIFHQVDVALWTIFVFFLTSQLIDFGWILGFQVLLGSALYILLGTLIDGGRGKKLFLFGAFGLATVWLTRAISVHNVADIVISQVFFALFLVFYAIPLGTALYNMAKKTKSTLWFHFFSEAGYDVGAMIVFFSSAALTQAGFQIQHLLPIAIIGIVTVKLVLDSYYKSATRH